MPIIYEIESQDSRSTRIARYVNKLFISEPKSMDGFHGNTRAAGSYSKSVKPRKNVHAWNQANKNNYPVGKFLNNTPIYHVGGIENAHKDEGKVTTKNISKPRKTVWERVAKAFNGYCENTTLHGLRYVGNRDLTIEERVFWLLSFLTAIVFTIYFITNIFTKFHSSPVIISFNPTPVLLNTFPFPSITICNVNLATKDAANRIYESRSTIDIALLEDKCSANSTFQNTTDSEIKAADWSYVRKFIISTTQTCNEMFKLCKWENIEVPCDDIINAVLTDYGYCCAFNRLPTNYSMKDAEDFSLNQTFPANTIDWNPEDGYGDNVDMSSMPYRGQGAGSHLGLTLALDANLDQYYCSTTDSVGFKVLLSIPIETPKIADFGFLVTTGLETRVAISPSLKDATDGIRVIDIKKRQCYFTHERYLKYFRVYTERNCRLECQANYTLEECKCVPYYLPRKQNTKICSKAMDWCTDRAKLLIEKYTPERSMVDDGKLVTLEGKKIVLACDCLPACHEITYTKTMSFGKMTSLMNRSLFRELADKNISNDYVINNMALVHFFFQNDKFTKETKSELYGFSELLSNTGGLLGLFLGFSFLSAVEIFYFIIVRVCCKLYVQKRDRKKAKDKKIALPFMD